mmetsp:Transcript_33001/g.74478  ORF Transcript_33001/g.74478 Transcript_33001/m.74478 type:complete len:332 (-) Transcript_33001:152-1147(-)
MTARRARPGAVRGPGHLHPPTLENPALEGPARGRAREGGAAFRRDRGRLAKDSDPGPEEPGYRLVPDPARQGGLPEAGAFKVDGRDGRPGAGLSDFCTGFDRVGLLQLPRRDSLQAKIAVVLGHEVRLPLPIAGLVIGVAPRVLVRPELSPLLRPVALGARILAALPHLGFEVRPHALELARDGPEEGGGRDELVDEAAPEGGTLRRLGRRGREHVHLRGRRRLEPRGCRRGPTRSRRFEGQAQLAPAAQAELALQALRARTLARRQGQHVATAAASLAAAELFRGSSGGGGLGGGLGVHGVCASQLQGRPRGEDARLPERVAPGPLERPR